MIIDAHAHLWKKQNGIVNGKAVYDIGGGRSDFGGEIKQMIVECQHFRGIPPLQMRRALSGGQQVSFRSGCNPLLKC